MAGHRFVWPVRVLRKRDKLLATVQIPEYTVFVKRVRPCLGIFQVDGVA